MNEDMIQAKNEGRFRAIGVSTMLLADLFKGGCFLKEDLPEDIVVDCIHYDHMRPFGLIVHLVSPRFEPVPPHEEIPIDNGVELFYLEHIHEKD